MKRIILFVIVFGALGCHNPKDRDVLTRDSSEIATNNSLETYNTRRIHEDRSRESNCEFGYDSLFGDSVLTFSNSFSYLDCKFRMDYFLKTLNDTTKVGKFAKENRASDRLDFIIHPDGSLGFCRKPNGGELNVIDKWVFDKLSEQKWETAECDDIPRPYYMRYRYHL